MSAPGLNLRSATVDDVGTIFDFIKELAEYEKLSHQVVGDEEQLGKTLFGDRPAAEVIIAEFGGTPAGFALFFHNYSTFLARPGLYLEDLYVSPKLRGHGIGKKLLCRLAEIAAERGCGRFEWSVLDWNEPAIRFYENLGAETIEGWSVFRVTGDALENLARSE
jgi:GNAT superfamily N-acetyltransferase